MTAPEAQAQIEDGTAMRQELCTLVADIYGDEARDMLGADTNGATTAGPGNEYESTPTTLLRQ
jgi:hypothetical protein